MSKRHVELLQAASALIRNEEHYYLCHAIDEATAATREDGYTKIQLKTLVVNQCRVLCECSVFFMVPSMPEYAEWCSSSEGKESIAISRQAKLRWIQETLLPLAEKL